MLFEFKKLEQTEADRLSDSVYAAMETGNPGAARTALASAPESLDGRIKTLRIEVQKKYGVRL
jgi:hypothetical protein